MEQHLLLVGLCLIIAVETMSLILNFVILSGGLKRSQRDYDRIHAAYLEEQKKYYATVASLSKLRETKLGKAQGFAITGNGIVPLPEDWEKKLTPEYWETKMKVGIHA